MNQNIIKIFVKQDELGLNQYLFLSIRSEIKYYKIPAYIDRWGDLVDHREVVKDVLMATDSLNNTHNTWRINGWKNAQTEIESLGYTFVKDMPRTLSHLTQAIEHKNLKNFIHGRQLVKLENLHPFVKGQIFTKKHMNGKAGFRISNTGYDYVVVEILSLPKTTRDGKPNGYHKDSMHYRNFKNLLDQGHLIEIKDSAEV